MISVDEVRELLRCEVSVRDAVETGLADALGAVLREDIRAPQDQPAFDRSAVDGFLVLADDTSEVFTVSGEIRAGDEHGRTPMRGQAVRIATGAPVPAGGEVIMLEDTSQSGESVRPAVRGQNHVRRRGEDARAGDVIAVAGTTLGAGAIALLASLGVIRPKVTRSIDALHVATGNEIVGAERTPSAAQVRDSNSPLVAAWARLRGLRLQQMRVGENEDSLRKAIEGRRDLLLVSGGASVGAHDFTENVLQSSGFDILVRKVAVRPGKPLIVARRGDEWAFGLPGNPLSHFVCLNLIVNAALSAMQGAGHPPAIRKARVLAGIAGNPRETWWPAVEMPDGLHPLRWVSSGDLTSLATADALVRVPSSGLAAGGEAEFIRTA